MGQEITVRLALRQKPTAFGIKDDIEPETIANALNAVRLAGHSQILILGSDHNNEWALIGDESHVTKICEMIKAMQVKNEKIEITVTPATPEERGKTGFCRIDLRLKK